MEENEENLFEEEMKKSDESSLQDKPDKIDETEAETAKESEITDESEEATSEEPIESTGFSSKPKGKREYDKIQLDEEFPEDGMILTIETVEPQPVYKTDMPLTSKFGEYYKKKLIINFEDEFNDRKLRELIPSVFYRIENGKSTPNLPKACELDDMEDNFTSKLSKLRYLYNTTFEAPEDLSDADFVAALVGKKVHAIKHIGKWKDNGQDKKYAELVIDKFVVDAE